MVVRGPGMSLWVTVLGGTLQNTQVAVSTRTDCKARDYQVSAVSTYTSVMDAGTAPPEWELCDPTGTTLQGAETAMLPQSASLCILLPPPSAG